MAKIKRRGQAGAAKAYVTRSAAVKKLQCSLADFRRLCILKGIFPREPRHKKKANKGSSAPTSFYYAKDIAYLAHEPVLKRLRDHKAFAKRFARALGRGEWSSAKSLEENKPSYQIDHIIKERYPSFVDAVRDLDDALCMIFLFASLPSNPRIPPSLIENCSKLAAQWQLYIIKSHAVRKVFLSIKGVYYQVQVMGENVTWLVPYMFTQNIPTDVDVRVMLTFLELYQTLIGFVLFKLYTDVGLVYPPPLDLEKEKEAAGLGAFTLKSNAIQEGDPSIGPTPSTLTTKKVTGRVVHNAIKKITDDAPETLPPDQNMDSPEETAEEFVVQPSSTSNGTMISDLPTLKVIESTPAESKSLLFAPFTFFLSRETPRPLFEFVIRSLGGRIGWHASQGAGSMVAEDDDSITHFIIDRPVTGPSETETEEQRLRRLRRKHVQPQWIVDCINANRILLEDDYIQGRILPPHLSPFGEAEGAYDPQVSHPEEKAEESESDDVESVDEEDVMEEDDMRRPHESLDAAVDDDDLLRTAELQAEMAGVDANRFDDTIKKIAKRKKKLTETGGDAKLKQQEEQMNKMLMSNKQRKLYEKLKYTQNKKSNERAILEGRRKQLDKQRKSRTAESR